MTNYYDNKGKNLFVMFSVFLYTFASILHRFVLDYSSKFPFDIYIKKYIINIPTLLFTVLPAVLLLVFAIFIFKDYKLKQFILPAYFLLRVVYSVISAIESYSNTNGIEAYSQYYIMLVLSGIVILSLLFLFIGSINHFYFSGIFKAGAILLLTYNVLILVQIIFLLIAFYFDSHSMFGVAPTAIIYNIISLLKSLLYIVLLVSLIVLSTRKKEPIVETNSIQE